MLAGNYTGQTLIFTRQTPAVLELLKGPNYYPKSAQSSGGHASKTFVAPIVSFISMLSNKGIKDDL